MSAVKYVETNRDQLVAKLLERVPALIKTSAYDDSNIDWIIAESLPAGMVHVDLLRNIMGCGDMIGGAAAIKLIDIGGDSFKEEVLEAMVQRAGDFNFGMNGAGPALSKIARLTDVPMLLRAIDSLALPEDYDEEDYRGLLAGAGRMLGDLDQVGLRNALLPASLSSPRDRFCAGILSESIWMKDSEDAIKTALCLWDLGATNALHTLSLATTRRASEGRPLAGFTIEHVVRLADEVINGGEEATAALRILGRLCKFNALFRERLLQSAENQTGLCRAALLDAAGADGEDLVEKTLRELVGRGPEALTSEPIALIRELQFSWVGREELFVSLCRLGNSRLLYDLTDALDRECRFGAGPKVQLELGEVEFWLEWLIRDPDWLFADRFGSWFCNYLSKDTQDRLIATFNKTSTPYRRVLAHHVLLRGSEISTDSFSHDAVSFLLSELTSETWPYQFHGSLLGNCATEAFVTERLLPLLYDGSNSVRSNVKRVLRDAGRRHGRRYFSDGLEEN
jgi:hypothetical protein